LLLNIGESLLVMLADSFKVELKEALTSISRFDVEKELYFHPWFHQKVSKIRQDIINDLLADKLKERYFFE
jgi:hypothetical protein